MKDQPHASSASPTTTSGRAGRGEAPALPDAHGTWTAIKGHQRHKEPNCDECRAFARDYHRNYYRAARDIDSFRQRHNALRRASAKRLSADPKYVEQRRQAQRERRRAARVAAEHDRRNLVDPVVVERLMRGETVDANRAEKQAAFHALIEKGHTLTAAAQQLGFNGQYARKYAALIGQESAA